MKKSLDLFVFSLLLFFFLLSCQNKRDKALNDESLPNQDSATIMNPEKIPNPYAGVDLSPMDMSYYPVDYPIQKMTGKISTPPVMRIIYSRPHLQGRKLFISLLKYGQPWRLGANEATEIEFYRDVNIQGKKIPAGRFIIYCMPVETKWTIVLNNNIDTWGLRMDSTKDFQRFIIPVTRNNPKLEYLTLVFEKTGNGADLIMSWDEFLARLPIEFTP
jgi:hypothetical protein